MTLQKPVQLLILLSLLLWDGNIQPHRMAAGQPVFPPRGSTAVAATQPVRRVVCERTFEVDGAPWVFTVVERQFRDVDIRGVRQLFTVQEVALRQPKATPPVDKVIWRLAGTVFEEGPSHVFSADVTIDPATKDIFYVSAVDNCCSINKLRPDSLPLVNDFGLPLNRTTSEQLDVWSYRRDKRLDVVMSDELCRQIQFTFGFIESLNVEKRQDALLITLHNHAREARTVTYSLTEGKWK